MMARSLPPVQVPEDARITSQFQVYLPGLGEAITHVLYEDPSGFVHKRTLRADGSVAKLSELLAAERNALEADIGRMTPGLAARVAEISPRETILVGVVFDPAIDEEQEQEISTELREEEMERLIALRSGDGRVEESGELVARESEGASRVVERFQGRTVLEAKRSELLDGAVRTRGVAIGATLQQRGYQLEGPESTTPVLYVRLSAVDVAGLAAEPDVSWLFDATGSAGAEQQGVNGNSFHKIDTGMNAAPNNLDGSGQRVGLIENTRCAIHDNHDAFKLAPATAYNNGTGHNSTGAFVQSCTTDSQCTNLCKTDSGDAAGVCRTLKSGVKRCVDPHLSKVASGVWGTRFQSGVYKNYGAGVAIPYVWTGSSASASNTACVVTETQLAYDWFNTNNVKTVIGSYGCFANGNSIDGFVEDWNAFHRDVAIFKATVSGGETTVEGCRSANAICVGGMTTTNVPFDGCHHRLGNNGRSPAASVIEAP